MPSEHVFSYVSCGDDLYSVLFAVRGLATISTLLMFISTTYYGVLYCNSCTTTTYELREYSVDSVLCVLCCAKKVQKVR